MNTYSREDFEDKFFQLSFYRVALGNCPSCKEWSAVQICNKSPRHEEFRQQEWKMRETAMTEGCTQAHPNHNFDQWACGNYMFYNTWCSKCKELGVEGGDLPPDLEEKYAKSVPQILARKEEERLVASKKLFDLLSEED